jgi:hypothetical protein
MMMKDGKMMQPKPGLSVAGIKISDRRFHPPGGKSLHHLVFDLPVDWFFNHSLAKWTHRAML